MVQQTAVDASMQSEGAELAFFDDLEMRPLASQDDAIHACLLLGTGSSGTSFEQRMGMAKELGYVPREYNRPARQAITMGEVSTMVVKILEGERRSEGDALAKLVHRGIAPASASANQGLTGAQLVSMAGGVRDAMGLEGVPRVSPPVVPEPVKAAAAQPVVAATESTPAEMPEEAGLTTRGVSLGEASKGEGPKIVTSTPEAPTPAHAPSTATVGTKGRAEPLPQIPVGTAPPAIELQDPKAKGSVIGPDQKVITPGQPKSEAKPKDTAKPTEPKKEQGKESWVTGQPLKKTAGSEDPK